MLGIALRLFVAGLEPRGPAVVPVEEAAPLATRGPLAAIEQPAAPAPDRRAIAEQRLREAVLGPFRGIEGRFGIAAKDLGSGLTVTQSEAETFQAASLFKLPVMYEVFKLREQGALTFDEKMTIGPADAANDLGTLPWPVGTVISLGTALERMITVSDNTGAFMLTRRVSSARINDDMLGLGLLQTRVRSEGLTTSAGDMLSLLEHLARGQAIDRAASGEMVHLLARSRIRDRIPAALPTEATVANKTGNWERAVHDVAIVYGPRATLVLAFLSDDVRDVDEVSAAMARAAREAYGLVHESSFDTSPEPPLPPMEYASYADPVSLPAPTVPPPPPATRPPAAPRQPTPERPAGVETPKPPEPTEPTATPAPSEPAPNVAQPTAAAAEPTRETAPTPASGPTQTRARQPETAATATPRPARAKPEPTPTRGAR